jgi:hypothetical protein
MAVCSEIHTKHTSIRLTKSLKHNYFIASQVSYKKSPHASARRQSSGEVLQQTGSVLLSLYITEYNPLQSVAVC